MVCAFVPPLGVKRFGAQLECVLLTAFASGNARSPRQPHKRCSRGTRQKEQRRPQAVSQRVLSAWVKSRHMRRNKSCPLYSQLRLQKRIFALRYVRFTAERADPHSPLVSTGAVCLLQ